MSQSRLALIHQAYRKLDKNGDGFITVADLKGVYNVKKNPKYLSGELTEEQILNEFLDRFEVGSKDRDSKVIYTLWCKPICYGMLITCT